jgi:hypothetical protein
MYSMVWTVGKPQKCPLHTIAEMDAPSISSLLQLISTSASSKNMVDKGETCRN